MKQPDSALPSRSLSRPAAGFLSAAAALALLVLMTGCVYVRVRGDLNEGDWVDDVIDEVHPTPASFQRGQTSLQYRGFLGNQRGKIEMEFECDPAELPAYLDGLTSAVYREAGRRDLDVVSMERTGPNGRRFSYDGEDEDGTIEMEVTERGRGRVLPPGRDLDRRLSRRRGPRSGRDYARGP